MYAPACSSASGSPPSSAASSRRRLLRGPGRTGAVQQEPRRHRRSSTGTSSTCPARPGPELAGDHHPPPARRRHHPRHRRRARHVIEDQQPVIPAGQHRMHPPHRITRPPRPGARPARRTPPPAPPGPRPATATPPATGRLPVRVLHRHAGLARTPQPAQHHHPRPRPLAPPAGHPARPAVPPGPPGTPAAAPAAPPPRAAPPAPAARPLRGPQLGQRLEQAHLHLRGRTHELDRDPRVLHPFPECPLPLPEHRIRQEHLRQRQHRVLIQHEHQPRQPPLPGLSELQLRVGKAGLVPDRRAVPEPDDPHVHIRLPDLLPAITCRLSSRAVKYAMSATTPPARVTACSAAATNERAAGYRRNSEV